QEVFGLLYFDPTQHLDVSRCQRDQADLFSLWQLGPNLFTAALLKLLDYANDAPVEINILPPQPKTFSSPRSGSQRDEDAGVELVARRRLEELPGLIGRQHGHLFTLVSGYLVAASGSRVEADQPQLDGTLQGAAQAGVDLHSGLRPQ